MKRIYSFLFASLALLSLVGCNKAEDKPEPTPTPPPTPPKTEETAAVTHTITPQGGNFDYKGDIKLVIPKDGVKENTKVEAKYAEVNKSLDLGSAFVPIGRDIVLKLNAENINKPFKVEFTAPEGFDPQAAIVVQYIESKGEERSFIRRTAERIVLHDLDYSVDNKITLRIDSLAKLREEGELGFVDEYVFKIIIDKRITAKEQTGLKQISFSSGEMAFNDPGDLTGKRCLLFVHGWTANPKSCWEKFARFANQNRSNEGNNYDIILTFGYNSGLRVDKNGATLANEIKKRLVNSTLDIVAHSMGGLVARSAIENHRAFPFVRSLVTIGTPHLGARLATLKLSKVLDNWYNLKEEGAQDLSETSDFITLLAKNAQPPKTNYYFIAGNSILTGAVPSDGVVMVNSAFNNSKDDEKTKVFKFSEIDLAHSLLTEDTRVISHTMDKLREFASPKTPEVDDNAVPEGVEIKDGVLVKWPSSAIPVNGHVKVPGEVKSIGNYAFRDCRNLKTIHLPEGLTSIGNEAFNGCSSLKIITIPNSVTTLGTGVFKDCVNLIEVKLPSKLKSIPNNAFQQCYNLAKIDLPNSIQTIGDAVFVNCVALKQIKLPLSLQNIGGRSFANCTSLSRVEFSDNLITMGGALFENCSNLDNIVLPSSLNEIPSNCFYRCVKLQSISLPTSIKKIHYKAFGDCTALKILVLPISLEGVDRHFIVGCPNLKTLTLKCPNPPYKLGGGMYVSDFVMSYSGGLIVPKGSRDRYASHDSWKHCSPIVEEE